MPTRFTELLEEQGFPPAYNKQVIYSWAYKFLRGKYLVFVLSNPRYEGRKAVWDYYVYDFDCKYPSNFDNGILYMLSSGVYTEEGKREEFMWDEFSYWMN